MRTFTQIVFFIICSFSALSQTNIHTTNPLATEIMLGNYDPADYMPNTIINHPEDLKTIINNEINADSLKSYLLKLSSFENRNTGSDTVSTIEGIGASRRWAYSMFENFSSQNENRLIPFYLQFDQNICGMGQHRNTCAILPGLDTSDPSIIIIEAHMDSRCEGSCDIDCTAHGMEDNGSGTALVLELARVMSQFAFDHTIVFMETIGEEQGLHGAHAFSQFCLNEGIGVRAVLNNDIVGGIICGETSSGPSCPGLNHVDSTQVRFFSLEGASKQLARFVKLEYQEELENIVEVPMMLTIMSAEDRTGRGGDHKPFRQRGFPAMRFTSANEHGNANVSDPNYHDRQHTTGDRLGVDTDGDNVIDSFFVDFNYLARNAVINGVSASLAAIGPVTPSFEGGKFQDSLKITIDDPYDYNDYRIFTRTNTTDFDTMYTLQGSKEITIKRVIGGGSLFRVSVAAVDANGIESLFTLEQFAFPVVNSDGEIIEEADAASENQKPIELFQNKPNPFDEATAITYLVHDKKDFKDAFILITDFQGKEIQRIKAPIEEGLNEVIYTHGYNALGTYVYSLVVDGKILESRQMIFAN